MTSRKRWKLLIWGYAVFGALPTAGCSGSSNGSTVHASAPTGSGEAGGPTGPLAGTTAPPGPSATMPTATGGAGTADSGSVDSSSDTNGPNSTQSGATPNDDDAGPTTADYDLGSGDGFYQMEALDRGLVAVSVPEGVYVGFRILGTEAAPLAKGELEFVLYRDGQALTTLRDSSNYLDRTGGSNARYHVTPRHRDALGPESAAVQPWAQPYLRIPLDPPSSAHTANDASAADLDGDGQYDLVLKWEPQNAQDNSRAGATDPVFLDGIKLDGQRLFRIDLGPNIRAGAHYTQFVVGDLDGDGRAELAVKTAPGTRDGTGDYLALGPAAHDDDSRVYRNSDGYILSGPEYLSIFSGASGEELATVDFDQARGDVRAWGDSYGNRVDRFLATAAYLDSTGQPSVVMARGYYTRSTLTAWNYRQGQLTRLWKFDSNDTPRDSSGKPFSGQGAHSLSVGNVDEDPQQEIIYGAMTIDHDGSGLCSTGLGHGDALHVSDLVPSRPGLEVFMPHEEADRPAWSLRDARTCELLRQGANTDKDVGRGVAADVVLEQPGAELWASAGIPLINAESGETIGPTPASINFIILWDADDAHELADGTRIQEITGEVLLHCEVCAANNSTKATPSLVADLLGDYREEILWREADNSALRLYTTTAISERALYTLMHDPQYRAAVSFQNAGYNQPAHPGFSLTAGPEPEPNIRLR